MWPQCGHTRWHTGGVARRHIYLSDDLERRVRDSDLNASEVCQEAIGRALNGGPWSWEAGPEPEPIDGHQAAAPGLSGRLDTIEQLLTAHQEQHQEKYEEMGDRLDVLEQRQLEAGSSGGRPDWLKMLAAFAVVILAVSATGGFLLGYRMASA
jgi:hypothetical protein